MQEPELHGSVLVAHHRAAGGRAADPLGVPPGEAAGRDPGQPGDLGWVEEPAPRAVTESRGEHRALATARPHGEPAQQKEGGHHQEDVGGHGVAAVVEQQRPVPGGVDTHRHDVPDERCQHAHVPPAGPHGDPDPDTDERGEEGVGERGEDAADDEQADRAADPTALAVISHVRRGQIEDVLGEREADADHAGVHQPVEHPVQLVAPVEEQQQDEQALDGFLGDRRDDRCHGDVGRLEDEGVEQLQDQRAGRRDERTPAESEQEQRAGFGLVAVEPHVHRDQRPHRHQREQQAGHKRSRGAGEQQQQAHGGSADQHHDRDDDRERGGAAASLHARSVTMPRS